MRIGERFRIADSSKGKMSFSVKEDHEVLTQLEVDIIDLDGNVVETIDFGENVIVDQGRANMSHLLAGDDVTNRKVYKMIFGDEGHDPADPITPLPAQSTDTALFGTEILEKILAYEFPDGAEAGKVTFTCTIAAGEGNGGGTQAYSEIGAFDVTDRMLTHKTFGLITKSDQFGLSWRYSFTF